jgi:hypothetical protein
VFVRRLKKVLTDALKATFDSEYVAPKWRGLPIYLDFPDEKADYPGIWVGFEIASDLQKAGVGQMFVTTREVQEQIEAGLFSVWRFQGWATFTGVALNNNERDWMFDEMVRVLAFGEEHDATQDFRNSIELNPYLAIDIDFDEIAIRGFSDTPGTPWGTDEVVSEFTVVMECLGEFVTDSITFDLVKLQDIQIQKTRVGPSVPGEPIFGPPEPVEDGWV